MYNDRCVLQIIKERRAVLENSEQKIVDENGKVSGRILHLTTINV
jgi:hypothetical protein